MVFSYTHIDHVNVSKAVSGLGHITAFLSILSLDSSRLYSCQPTCCHLSRLLRSIAHSRKEGAAVRAVLAHEAGGGHEPVCSGPLAPSPGQPCFRLMKLSCRVETPAVTWNSALSLGLSSVTNQLVIPKFPQLSNPCFHHLRNERVRDDSQGLRPPVLH